MLTNSLGGDVFLKEDESLTAVVEKELMLLERHLIILKAVWNDGPIGIIKLSQITGEPQHMVRYSLRTLEKNGIIRPSPSGAIITDDAPVKIKELANTLDRFQKKIVELKQQIKNIR
ncbi:MAG: hypothetical protein DRN12_01420 [Thermoplasmata archaeon]|nr:MAG: hypothetical protein DRN12_01420 [Thermoplasmata archaeon]HEC89112.1 hypothetical protein [Thermoplasmatales archaeon]